MDEEINKDQPATISAPPAPPITIDPQNPLPEKSFFWRRIFTIAITLNTIVFSWVVSGWFYAAGDLDKLYGVTKILLYGDGAVLLMYFVAPSASEITNMIATASIWKKSIQAATDTAKNALSGAESGQGAPKPAPASADSQFVPPPPGAVPDSPEAEIDAAPRPRT